MVTIDLDMTPDHPHGKPSNMVLKFEAADDVTVFKYLEHSFDDFMRLVQTFSNVTDYCTK